MARPRNGGRATTLSPFPSPREPHRRTSDGEARYKPKNAPAKLKASFAEAKKSGRLAFL